MASTLRPCAGTALLLWLVAALYASTGSARQLSQAQSLTGRDYDQNVATSTDPSQRRYRARVADSNGRRARKLYGLDKQRIMSTNWPGYIASLDQNRLAPLTLETQRAIYAHQHPPPAECKNKTFVVLHNSYTGLGSQIHRLSAIMAGAIEHGHIVMYHDFGRDYTKSDCRAPLEPSFDCLFQPITSCKREDATAHNTAREAQLSVPSRFVQQLEAHFAPAKPQLHWMKYWWRAQGAAFIMRPLQGTLKQLSALRLLQDKHAGLYIGPPGEQGGNATVVPQPVPFPLPAGTVSAHVRHGDKGIEMPLQEFRRYVEMAERMVALNALGLRRRLFVSSEDPAVIEEAKQLLPTWTKQAADTHWTVYYSHIYRVNGGPADHLRKHPVEEVVADWLLQLWMALECDMWVGTRGSNWNRLIDELRCVMVDKCSPNIFMEVGPDHTWADDWNWRRAAR